MKRPHILLFCLLTCYICSCSGLSNSASRQMKSLQSNIIPYVDANVSAKEYSWYPLPEKQCQIGKVMFVAEKQPMQILFSGKTVFIESNARDEKKFKTIAAKIVKKFRLRGTRFEDQGARLSIRASLRNVFTYQDIIESIYTYYYQKFDDVRLEVSCQNMPRWIIRWFRPGWKNIIEAEEKKPNKARPKRRKKRRK